MSKYERVPETLFKSLIRDFEFDDKAVFKLYIDTPSTYASAGLDIPRSYTLQDWSVNDFRQIHFSACVFSKYSTGELSSIAYQKAVCDFNAGNLFCKDFVVSVPQFGRKNYRNSDRGCTSNFTDVAACLADLRQDFRHLSWYSDLTIRNCFINGNAGPGSSAGRGNKDTSYGAKHCWGVLTATTLEVASLYKTLAKLCSKTSYLAECERQAVYGDILDSQIDSFTVVPKKVTSGRGIIIAPSVNMWFQKGLSYILEVFLLTFFGISLANQQEFNKELARIGSLTQGYATLDLRNASNRISLNLLRWLCKGSPLYDLVMLFRSSFVNVPKDQAGTAGSDKVRLHMVSGMGAGFTFSLMTLIFAFVIRAAYKELGIPMIMNKGSKHGNFGVFGDDIIVVSHAVPLVWKLLETLGFEINRDKSFGLHEVNPDLISFFRESCGGDYYKGILVTPIYIKSMYRGQEDVHLTANRIVEYCATHATTMKSFYASIKSMSRKGQQLLVPRYFDDCSGFHTPEYDLSPKNRFFGDHGLLDRVMHFKPYKVMYLKALDKSISIYDDQLTTDTLLAKLLNEDKLSNSETLGLFHPNGQLAVILRGDIEQNGTMSLRLKSVKFVRRTKEVSSWEHPNCGDDAHVRIETADEAYDRLGRMDLRAWKRAYDGCTGKRI